MQGRCNLPLILTWIVLACSSFTSSVLADNDDIVTPELVPNSWIVILANGASFQAHAAWLDKQIKEKWKPVDGYPVEPLLVPLNDVPTDGTSGPTLPGYLITGASEEFARTLTMHETVDIVQPNRYHYMLGVQSNIESVSLPSISNEQSSYSYPDTAGQNVDVYLLDSGVTVDHPDFEGRARNGPSFADNGTTADLTGHGTHLAGVVASKTFGVAKKASIVSVKVLDINGTSTTATIVQGINYAIANSLKESKPSIINLSLGGSSKDFVLELAISQAVLAGIAVTVAAGNEGREGNACLKSPAGASAAFAVAAAHVKSDGSVAWAPYSTGGVCVRGIAPGSFIPSLAKDKNERGAIFSGSSVASTHVAGVMALLLSQKKFASVDKLYDAVNELSYLDGKGRTVQNTPKNTFNYLVYNGGVKGVLAIPAESAAASVPSVPTTTLLAATTVATTPIAVAIAQAELEAEIKPEFTLAPLIPPTPKKTVTESVFFGVVSKGGASKGLVGVPATEDEAPKLKSTSAPAPTKTAGAEAPQPTFDGKLCAYPICLGMKGCDYCVLPMSLITPK
ncbi:serine protease [Phlyctochytrium planicorne]|nr:serine protease [Phlyctochytrium planicorne]